MPRHADLPARHGTHSRADLPANPTEKGPAASHSRAFISL